MGMSFAFSATFAACVAFVLVFSGAAFSAETSSYGCGVYCQEIAQPQNLPPALKKGKVVAIHGYRMKVPKGAEAIGVLNDSLFIRYSGGAVLAVSLDTKASAAVQLEYLRDADYTLTDWAVTLYTKTPEDHEAGGASKGDAYRSIMQAKETYFAKGRVAHYKKDDLTIFRVSGNARMPYDEVVTVVDPARPNQLLYVSSTGIDADTVSGVVGSIVRN